MKTVFFSPHMDDETLFGAFTIMREKPHIIFVYGGDDHTVREGECLRALEYLGNPTFSVWNFKEKTDNDNLDYLIEKISKEYDVAFAPTYQSDGNRDHNTVNQLVEKYFTGFVGYTTYGWPSGRTIGRIRVDYTPKMLWRKMKAMTCYFSQINNDMTAEQFIYPQYEYYE